MLSVEPAVLSLIVDSITTRSLLFCTSLYVICCSSLRPSDMDTTSFCITVVPGLNCAQLAKGGLSTISSGPGLADWAPTEHASPTIRIPAAATTRRNFMGNLLAADPLLRARFFCTRVREPQQGEPGRAAISPGVSRLAGRTESRKAAQVS